jgi:hypothetical protein
VTTGNGDGAAAPTLEERVGKLEADVRTIAQAGLDTIEANRAGLLEIAGQIGRVNDAPLAADAGKPTVVVIEGGARRLVRDPETREIVGSEPWGDDAA